MTTQWSKLWENVFYIHTIYLGALPCPSQSCIVTKGTHPKVTHRKYLEKKRKKKKKKKKKKTQKMKKNEKKSKSPKMAQND